MTVTNKTHQDARTTREEIARTLQNLQAQVRNDLGGRVSVRTLAGLRGVRGIVFAATKAGSNTPIERDVSYWDLGCADEHRG